MPWYGHKLYGLIRERGTTKAHIERLMGVSSPTLDRWLNDRNEPKYSQVVKLADFFQVPLKYFTEY